VDDRILLIPTTWAPDAQVWETWPSLQVLLGRLKSFLPVDLYRWPTLRGEQPAEGNAAEASLATLKGAMKPYHHVVNLSFTGWALARALEEARPRSIVFAGLMPSPRAVRAVGGPELEGAVNIVFAVSKNPGQMLRITMQGAPEEQVVEETRRLESTLDRSVLEEIIDVTSQADYAGLPSYTVPTLYLATQVAVPGAEYAQEILKSWLTDVREDVLYEWPLRLHEETGGRELADKVIPFIQEVITARTKP
jgi:hypothetical protein